VTLKGNARRSNHSRLSRPFHSIGIDVKDEHSMKGAKMIREIQDHEIELASDYIWKVYQDETKRTTPPYHALEEIEAQLLKCLQSESTQVMGVYWDDTLKGVTLFNLEVENNYLSVQGPYIKNLDHYMTIASEIIEYLEKNFKGYECHFGTTKTNLMSQEFLEKNGFLCTEDTIQMSVAKDGLIPIDRQHNIQALTEERMDEYAAFHDKHYHDYFWLSNRIYERMDQWKIHILLVHNEIIGSIFTRGKSGASSEIYGCKVMGSHKCKQVLAELYYISSKTWLDQGVLEILNFVPEGVQSESASLVGYKAYGTYLCYYKNKI
jgi:hypothetical protein